jgi:hypothetical protein
MSTDGTKGCYLITYNTKLGREAGRQASENRTKIDELTTTAPLKQSDWP